MGLKKTYPVDFERVWRAYPDWPKGRSKKADAYKAWQKLLKEGWDDSDTDQLVADIEERKRKQESWQRGHRYAPPMMSTYLNRREWENDYKAIKPPPTGGNVHPLYTEEELAEKARENLERMQQKLRERR